MSHDHRDNTPRPGSQNPLQPRPTLKEELWKATPCTMPYVSVSNSFDHSDRFKQFSIYHKDDVNKPKPVFNDIEKPQLLLQQFRRQIAEASSDRFKRRNILDRRSSQKERMLSLEPRGKSRQSQSPDRLVTDRLYKLAKRQDGRYDRFGIRCNLEEEDGLKPQPMQTSQQQQKSFSEYHKPEMNRTQTSGRASFLTSSRRIDLSRPLNFYPAPNSYRHFDFLEEKKWTPAGSRTTSLVSRRLNRHSAIDNHEVVE